MNEFLVFFHIVSIFVFDAFCTNPLIFGPPPPANVQFDDCLFVPYITSKTLSVALYNYRHICWEKFTDEEPQRPEQDRSWYLVGRLRDLKTLSADQPEFVHVPIKQSLIQFVFLKETTLEFVLESTDRRFQIIFQSIQQRQAFYEMIYHGVNMQSIEAANKIGMLHEIIETQDQEIIKIGDNVEVLLERINHIWYITFTNDHGEPFLTFCQTEAAIMRVDGSPNFKPQILMRVTATLYILTFLKFAEAAQFSDAFLKYVKILRYGRIPADVRACYESNQITMIRKTYDIA